MVQFAFVLFVLFFLGGVNLDANIGGAAPAGGGPGKVIQVLAYRVRMPGRCAGECPSVLAYSAREDGEAWIVPARSGICTSLLLQTDLAAIGP